MPSSTHEHRQYELRLVREDDPAHPITFWLDVLKTSNEHPNSRLCPNSSGRMCEIIQGVEKAYTGTNPCQWGMVKNPQATYVLEADKKGVPTKLQLQLDFRAQKSLADTDNDYLLGCVIPKGAFPKTIGEGTMSIRGEFTRTSGAKTGIHYTFDVQFVQEAKSADNTACGYKPGEQGFGSIIAIFNGIN